MKKLLASLVLAFASISAIAQQSGNVAATILASGAHTAVQVNSADQTNCCWQAAHVIINVSAYTSGNYTPKIQAKDPVSGNYYDLLVGTAISSTGTTIIKIGPGLTTITNASSADILPKTWRVQLNGASTPSMAFSVGAFLGE